MPRHEDLSAELQALVDDAVTFAVSAKKTTDFAHPFLLTASASAKEHRVFAGMDAAAAVEEARRQARGAPSDVLRCVIAYDGLLRSTTGKALLAFMFEAGERGQPLSFIFYQRYRIDPDGEPVLIFDERGGFLRSTLPIVG